MCSVLQVRMQAEMQMHIPISNRAPQCSRFTRQRGASAGSLPARAAATHVKLDCSSLFCVNSHPWGFGG